MSMGILRGGSYLLVKLKDIFHTLLVLGTHVSIQFHISLGAGFQVRELIIIMDGF